MELNEISLALQSENAASAAEAALKMVTEKNTLPEKILETVGNDIFQYKLLTTDQLCFEDGVREACKLNYCGKYGHSWTCPPACGEIEELKAKMLKYKNVFVFTTKHDIEDSFDIEGMHAAHKRHDKITSSLRDICSEHSAMILAAGSCTICEKCAYPDAPCRFPDKALTSLEACGINVMTLSKTAGINYINGTNTVTYFTAVLFN